ncbi:MAG: hypothetical protein HYS12_07740 [Planctomycetes bacterium]|nr:hypothetical protein [Planctomycetota bacterium]
MTSAETVALPQKTTTDDDTTTAGDRHRALDRSVQPAREVVGHLDDAAVAPGQRLALPLPQHSCASVFALA